MDHHFGFIIFIIIFALLFDFMNGFHDAANSIATVVSTRVLKPYWAVILAAFFNFIAFLVFGLHVASTIGKGVVDPTIVDPEVVLGALMGAMAWNIITWFYGIPSSSSHALIGGLGGAAVTKSGFHVLELSGILKILVSIFLYPILGGFLGFLFRKFMSFLLFYSTPKRVDRLFRKLQLISASLYSLGHGGNDAQKTMGIIAVLLFSSGITQGEFIVPFWVILACHAAMGLGTLMGGWRIVYTMGMKITRLQPVGGFCAENAGALTLFSATVLGIPVSTTHTITGAIIGVGAEQKLSAVRWGIARRILWAWVLTIPASAIMASLFWSGVRIILSLF